MILVWRIYEKPIPDGFKILVDRLWPRGIGKDQIDYWAKEIAPSDVLRKWFSHDPKKWEEFIEKYKKELEENGKLSDFIKIIKEKENTIFLYSSKEKNYNNANALKIIIESML
ncbi:MAG: DUF488 domain-containing protein [Thermoplasmata archaeon]|nr:DUF488 family protein [Thermoplasmata archaeon]